MHSDNVQDTLKLRSYLYINLLTSSVTLHADIVYSAKPKIHTRLKYYAANWHYNIEGRKH